MTTRFLARVGLLVAYFTFFIIQLSPPQNQASDVTSSIKLALPTVIQHFAPEDPPLSFDTDFICLN